MAKKSNKTAHVLNLLSGHDAANEAEEPSLDAEFSGDEDGQAPMPATAEPGFSDNGDNTAAVSSGIPAPQPAPAKASAASQNNISLIDTTGEDPVADLIQEKLSSEFEKQMQESQAKDSNTLQTSADTDPSSLAEEKPDSEGSSAESERIASNTGSSEDEGAVSDTGSVEDEQGEVVSDPVENGEDITEPILAETSSEDHLELQEALEMNRIENADSLSEAKEEAEAMAEMEADLETEPVLAEQAAPEPQPAAAPEPEPLPDFAAVNVMERIVQDKIIYFMRQFDVCTCDRCKADVIALTLNGLLPKYIVTMPSAVDPLISYYTNRLISDVTVEATKACMVVKENPRH